jgi:hypothetical protein
MKPLDDAALRAHLRAAFRQYWAAHDPYDDRKAPRAEVAQARIA